MALVEHTMLVVVSGAAASGKTSLATRLARELRLPLLSRDMLKESLMDSLGSPSRAPSRGLGGASYAILYTVLDQLLVAGMGAVVESNFARGLAERELQARAAAARMVQVHCGTTPEESRRRYIARAASGERHPGHHDGDDETLADFEASLACGRHEPLDLGVPLICVDTTSGYAPDFETILRFVLNSAT